MFAKRRQGETQDQVVAQTTAHSDTSERKLVEALEALVRSKLTSSVPLDGALGDALTRLVKLVKSASTNQMMLASNLGKEATEAAVNIGWLSHDFSEVAQSTVSISSAVEQMGASIAELSTVSAGSATQTENARDTMRSCINDSRAAVEAMNNIQSQSSKIGEQVTVLQSAVDQIGEMATSIDSIARQTNLLALNATIEAARAGEAGRGFAVVAAEVKTLSVETGKATQEIRSRVEALTREMREIRHAVADSLKSVTSGSAVVTQVGTIIESMGDEVAEVAEKIRGLSNVLEQQRAATTEITQNVVRISEKAVKSKDEVQKIGKRLEDCEGILRKAFERADLPIRAPALIRVGSEALSWKRQLAQILLGQIPLPAGALLLPQAGVMAEAEEICRVTGSGSALAADLSTALANTQTQGSKVIEEVRNRNWGAATPAYIACDEAIGQAHQAIAKLLEKAAQA
ncbi:methyl-accepting chemotaxis protein [Hyphomicrobium sp.]|uniref:methyl-accepting chemotaxis protein n=1 Tax=Hyphomicrobium sp. TaxID=82 RepID=UPI002E305AB8|nr:methyl-accepting chemotaxis protein [Hyphomicrobium sp.]HEX2842821.1 methyl-accepting chemotaxis protein [Hyphomicrobium sp.]